MQHLEKTIPQRRPRERLRRYGAQALTEVELLALVLGHGTQGRDVLSVATSLLDQVGSVQGLLEADLSELGTVPGIGPVTAAKLAASLELAKRALVPEPELEPLIRGADDVHRLLRPRIVGLGKEVFWALALTVRHRVLRVLRIAEGCLSGVEVHPREVFRPLIRIGAGATILAHNHPSGDPAPSREDLNLTRRLREVGELTGIPVLDHVIVTPKAFVSLAALSLP